MENAKYLFSYPLSDLMKHYMEVTKSKQFDWKIWKGEFEKRYKSIKDKTWTLDFKKHFENEYQRTAEATTLISYFDTLSLIQRLANEIDSYVSEKIHVFMEFQIPYAEMKRTDFIFVFKNTVLLLEMGNSSEKKNRSTMYNEKLIQVMQYEKLVQNLISPKMYTVPYVILYDYEYDYESKEENYVVSKNVKNNNERISKLAELIQTLYYKDSTALEEIRKLIS